MIRPNLVSGPRCTSHKNTVRATGVQPGAHREFFEHGDEPDELLEGAEGGVRFGGVDALVELEADEGRRDRLRGACKGAGWTPRAAGLVQDGAR